MTTATLTKPKAYPLTTGEAMSDYLATAIAEGFGEGEGAPAEDQLQAWQYLHDTGLAYRLQGWFGRTAQNLISNDIIDA